MHSRIVKVLVTIAVFLGGAGMLVYSSLSEAEYYKHVDELMATPAEWSGKTLRVHGFVEAGSIQEKIVDQQTKRRFVLEYRGKRLTVEHQGPKPDTFKDLAEVVAKGKVVEEDGGYVLQATELTAKCPSKYQAGERTDDYGQPPPKPNTQSLDQARSAAN
jgi:cytochrome c-type biogenesis protein CcmE